MRVILARHGDALNTKGKFHGMNDEPMTSAGRSEIYQLATRLKPYEPLTIVYSPLKRTTESAKILAEELGIPAHPSQKLYPLDLGNFVGKPVNERTTEQVRFYLAHPFATVPGGESVEDWAARYLPIFERYLASRSNETVLFMTHGRNIVLSRAYMKDGGAAPAFDKEELVDNTDATEHGGFAIAHGNRFRVVTPKKVAKGLS
jgi:probable phosphoglycerate mutase